MSLIVTEKDGSRWLSLDEPIDSENIICPYCGYEHCDLMGNEAPKDNFKCDNCKKKFNVAVIIKTFYETTRR